MQSREQLGLKASGSLSAAAVCPWRLGQLTAQELRSAFGSGSAVLILKVSDASGRLKQINKQPCVGSKERRASPQLPAPAWPAPGCAGAVLPGGSSAPGSCCRWERAHSKEGGCAFCWPGAGLLGSLCCSAVPALGRIYCPAREEGRAPKESWPGWACSWVSGRAERLAGLGYLGRLLRADSCSPGEEIVHFYQCVLPGFALFPVCSGALAVGAAWLCVAFLFAVLCVCLGCKMCCFCGASWKASESSQPWLGKHRLK